MVSQLSSRGQSCPVEVKRPWLKVSVDQMNGRWTCDPIVECSNSITHCTGTSPGIITCVITLVFNGVSQNTIIPVTPVALMPHTDYNVKTITLFSFKHKKGRKIMHKYGTDLKCQGIHCRLIRFHGRKFVSI